MTESLDDFLDYLQKAGLNTVDYCSHAWKLLETDCEQKNNIKKLIRLEQKDQELPNSIKPKSKQLPNSIEQKNGQKMSIGKLVQHRTVPALGLGLVVAESNQYKGYWMVKWCDQRYSDVGHLGIEESYLEIV